MKNKVVLIVIGALVVGGACFFIGMKYGEGVGTTSRSAAASSFAARAGQFGGTAGGQRGARGGGGLISGKILSNDKGTLTIQDSTGSSKIVFLTSSTTIMKFSAGSPTDLSAGTQVTATGSANSDGSISAQSVQIRPAGAPGSFSGQ